MSNLTLCSLFDGSGGFSLGGLLVGITPVSCSEIEPFPIRVTTKRLPQVKHLGDIHNIYGGEIAPVDIITFGSPCTDLSVAGRREGLGGEKSVLFYEAIRIIKEMREKTDGKFPRYAVWENVPGAFSSNKGADFQSVLEAFVQVKEPAISVPKPEKWAKSGKIVGDGYSIAYRTLNAQHFGVPQRRKRIYLIADFDGECAEKILFEPKSLSRDSQSSRMPWERTPSNPETSLGATSNGVSLFENHSQDSRYAGPLATAQTISATYGTGGNNQPFVVETPKTLKIRSGCEGGGKGALVQEDLSATLSTHNDQTVFVPFGICSKDSNAMKSTNPHSGIYEADTSRTLDGNGGNPSCNQGGVAVVAIQGSVIGRKNENGPQGSGVSEDVSFTLNTIDHHAVVYALDRESMNAGRNFDRNVGLSEDGISSTLTAQGPGAVGVPTYSMTTGGFMNVSEGTSPTLTARDYKDPPLVTESEYIVRKLTPTECARLQGFPDDWCSDLGTEDPTEEELAFWFQVFETHKTAMGKTTKPKTEKQMRKWLADPHSDSAEYKMWGNGVALPCVVEVLGSLVYYSQNEGL